MASADLQVALRSTALSGLHLDVIVTGSIGAVESVRFIRSLRRLGASVTPWLTEGGKQFVTETSLSWAAARPAVTQFMGDATHVAIHDGAVIAPASADFLSKLSLGLTDSPALALCASYLGSGKPVLALPSMHDSLFANPFLQDNLQRLQGRVVLLSSREEEGKKKFADPDMLADQTAHVFRRLDKKVLVTLGTTRGYIDDVRYISNYSSGRLGTEIAHELYRAGIDTLVVAGPAQFHPTLAGKMWNVETNEEMAAAIDAAMRLGFDASVACASVLDFVPDVKRAGKIRSSETLNVSFKATEKLIAKIPPQRAKVGFKLEFEVQDAQAQALATDYAKRYGLSLVIVNALSDVGPDRHHGRVFHVHNHEVCTGPTVSGKIQTAQLVANHILSRLS